jgi:hypothetical protein
VTRIGHQRPQVLLRGVRLLPSDALDEEPPEYPGSFDLSTVARQVFFARERQARRCRRVEPLVAGLDLREEALVTSGGVMRRQDRRGSADPEGFGGLRDPNRTIHPVERRRGHHGIERLRRWRPRFEGADLDRGERKRAQVPTGDLRHRPAGLERDDVVPRLASETVA